MTLVLVLAAGVAFTIWRIQRATPPARPEPVTFTVVRDGSTTDPHCTRAGHYYRKAFADMWRCVNCGHLQPVTNRDVAEEAATELRGELGAIEAFANKEAR